MIVTVTPNPAYDVTYEIPPLTAGEVHRVTAVHQRPGGKGVNVASVLRRLAAPVVATGFATPSFSADVEALGIRASFVDALPRVRRTLAVVDPAQTTSLWEPGAAPVDPTAAEAALITRVRQLLADATVLVVSGSLPAGVSPSLPADLAGLAHEHGVQPIIDTSGRSLAAAAAVPGVVLMPNADELAELCGTVDTAADAAKASRSLIDGGVAAVFATRGRDGMVVTDRTGSWQVAAPRDVRGNPTGAGDAAAAAVAHALARGNDVVTAACDAVALAATAVAAPVAGDVDLDLYAELRGSVAAQPLH